MRIRAGALTVVGLVLAACGSSEPQQPAVSGTAGTAAASGVERGGPDSVAAVLQSAGTPFAGLWFEMPSAPVVGQAFALKLQVGAQQPQERVDLRIESPDLIASPDKASLSLPQAREHVAQEVTVTARNAGMTELTVHLAGSDGAAATYAIPVWVKAAGQ